MINTYDNNAIFIRDFKSFSINNNNIEIEIILCNEICDTFGNIERIKFEIKICLLRKRFMIKIL